MPSRIPVLQPRTDQQRQTDRTASAPTKLERLREQYQAMIQREREQKIQQLPAGLQPRSSSWSVTEPKEQQPENNTYVKPQVKGVVRDLFRERRDMNRNGANPAYMNNIESHYKQLRAQRQGSNSDVANGWTQSAGRPPRPTGPQYEKHAAGRDKGTPLAPLDRQASNASSAMRTPKPPSREAKPNMVRPYHRRNSQESPAPLDNYKMTNPKARKPWNTTGLSSTQPKSRIPSIATDPQADHPAFRTGQQTTIPVREKQIQKRPRQKDSGFDDINNNKTEKLSDFRKWQIQQDQIRKERLERLQNRIQADDDSAAGITQNGNDRGSFKHPTHQIVPGQKAGKSRMPVEAQRAHPPRKTSPSPSPEDDEAIEVEKVKKLREKRRQARPISHLAHGQRPPRPPSKTTPQPDSPADTDDEGIEAEKTRRLKEKHDQLQRLLLQKQQELEELQRTRMESEQAEEMPKQQLQTRQSPVTKPQRSDVHGSQRKRYHELHEEYSSNDSSDENSGPERTPTPPKSKPPPPRNAGRQSRSSRPPSGKKPVQDVQRRQEVAEMRAITPNNSNTAFYLEMANTEEATDVSAGIALQECHTCGRKFAPDRLAKHYKVCKKASSKKRKVFDPVKMRNKGTENENYVMNQPPKKNAQPAKKKKPNNWKAQHENFIQSIRYAKQVAAVESQGGNVNELPPPPPTQNPDYEQCPHCQRRFNAAAAERHIPRCQKLKTKPPPQPRGRRY